jgi:hypothetical protein
LWLQVLAGLLFIPHWFLGAPVVGLRALYVYAVTDGVSSAGYLYSVVLNPAFTVRLCAACGIA